jgi:hypothetical protein
MLSVFLILLLQNLCRYRFVCATTVLKLWTLNKPTLLLGCSMYGSYEPSEMIRITSMPQILLAVFLHFLMVSEFLILLTQNLCQCLFSCEHTVFKLTSLNKPTVY